MKVKACQDTLLGLRLSEDDLLGCELNIGLVFGVDRSNIRDCSGKNCWLSEAWDSYGREVYVQNRGLFGGANYWMLCELEDGRVIVAHGAKILTIILCIHVINKARICCAIWVHNSTSKIKWICKLRWFSLSKYWSSRLIGTQCCGDQSGYNDFSSATIPDTWGVAMEVPERKANAPFVGRSGGLAANILTPGAAISGCATQGS
ncbi:hypothetical protein QQP08_010207 [Theobroma cacao]|nr:hypothetical protein QQP08_010207 [Theobroma cacao]